MKRKRLGRGKVHSLAFFKEKEKGEYAWLGTASNTYIIDGESAEMVKIRDDVAFLWHEKEGKRYIDRLYLSIPSLKSREKEQRERYAAIIDSMAESLQDIESEIFSHLFHEELGSYLGEHDSMLELHIRNLFKRYKTIESKLNYIKKKP